MRDRLLGKTVILLTKTADDIPFDLRHYKHIIHEGSITNLLPQLESSVRWALQEPKNEMLYPVVELYIDGHRLPSETEILLPIKKVQDLCWLHVDAHNPTDKQLKQARIKIGILLSALSNLKPVTLVQAFDFYKQPDGTGLFVLTKGAVLNPGSWKSFDVSVYHAGRDFKVGDSISATIRVFSQEGVIDFPFSITLIADEQS